MYMMSHKKPAPPTISPTLHHISLDYDRSNKSVVKLILTELSHMRNTLDKINERHTRIEEMFLNMPQGKESAELYNYIRCQMPIRNLEELDEVNDRLRDDNYKRQMTRYVRTIKKKHKLMKKLFRKFFTDTFLINCGWSDTKPRALIDEYYILQFLYEAWKDPRISKLDYENILENELHKVSTRILNRARSEPSLEPCKSNRKLKRIFINNASILKSTIDTF